MHSVEDNQRRVREGRALRQRRFHLHKFFLWNEHSSGFDGAARNLIRLRNTLYDHDEAYAVDPASAFFTTIHVTHYRQGGDFICEHSDLDFHMRQGLDSPFEVLTLLSKKGKDYFTGGQFIRKGKTYYKTDEETDPGDVIIYDVSQPHGCAPVDPELPEDSEGVMGRWFMLVPPYRISKHMVVK